MKTFNQEEIKNLVHRGRVVQKEIDVSQEKMTERAIEAFKDHKITVLTNNKNVQAFECRNGDGSWCYGFRVVFSDNLICMYGDCGELVVNPGYGRQGIRWMRGSIKSKGYFFEKTDRAYIEESKRFSERHAIASAVGYIYDDLDEIEDYQQGELNLLNDCINGEIMHEHDFYNRAYSDYGFDECPDPRDVFESLEYRYQALVRLCELLDEIDFSIDMESK